MTYQFIPLLAALAGALIAGYFSFVTLINSKEQKTSEFRQDWIDSLRKEIAEFTSTVYFLKFYYQQGAKNTDPEFINGLKDLHIKYVSSSTAILLRINANETNKHLKAVNDEFLRTLSDILQAVNREQYGEAATNCNTLIDKAKPLLKEEWKRVKAGELSYRAIKYFSIILFIGAAIFASNIAVAPSLESNKIIKQGGSAVDAKPIEKTNNSQNCSLSVSLESSRSVTSPAIQEKTTTCNRFQQQIIMFSNPTTEVATQCVAN